MALTLIVFMLQIAEENKKPDTFVSHNWAEDSPPHEFLVCCIITDCDHATGQFPLLGVSGLLPFDEEVAVRYNDIIESTIIRYF